MATKIIELGYLLNNQGRLVLVGVPKVGSNINIFSLPMHFGKKIIGSHGGESNPEKDIPRFLNLFNNNKSSIKNMVSRRFKLNDINEAISCFQNGSISGRIIIDL